jgi:uncharacterized membrane protein YdjX (TVP38/TMEM64 family)
MAFRNGASFSGRVAGVALALVALLALGWLVIDIVDRLGGPPGIRERFGHAALVLLLPIFATPAVPGEFAGFLTVSLFGFALGVPLVWSGLIFRALIEYALSSRIRGKGSKEDTVRGLPRWLARFPAHHPVFLVAGRWMPLGNHIVSVVAGLRGVPLWRFAWTSAIGLAPFALLIAAGTAGLVAAHG